MTLLSALGAYWNEYVSSGIQMLYTYIVRGTMFGDFIISNWNL